MDTPVVDQNHEIVKNAIDTARKHLKDYDELLPTFFVGGKEGLNIVGAPFSGPDPEHTKDMVARAVKAMIKKVAADFVLFISEAWSLQDNEAAQDYQKFRHKYPGGVKSHPKAIEIVMFALETKKKNIMGRAPILPGRELGEIEWIDFSKAGSGVGGRFSNFFGNKLELDSEVPDGKTVH